MISSDEVNYLIYRYLKESGFQHTAFTFGHESNIIHIDVNPSDVQTGSLINIIQKGVLYEELEAVINKDSESETGVLVKSINKSIKGGGKKRSEKEAIPTTASVPLSSSSPAPVFASAQPTPPPKSVTPTPSAPTAPTQSPSPVPTVGAIIDERNIDVRAENVLLLSGHLSEVFQGLWNPKQPLFASCAGDATARIWRIGAGPVVSRAIAEAARQPTVLKHAASANAKVEKSKDVTAMDWNPVGTLLATGSSDGLARIWDAKGTMKAKLQRHTLPIFALRWSKSGDYLLSGSADKLAVIWDAASGQVKQVFDFHTQACLDVDWRNNTSFASCSSDTLIHVCELGKTKPIATFEGHTQEVNTIRWDPHGILLASCSDDKTCKVWKLDSPSKPVWDFNKGHDLEIYTVRWSPSLKQSLLATASYDKTVRLWDATAGKCLYTLDKHDEPVYSVAFSPDGEFIASGSLDRCVHIWSVKDGSLVKTYKGTGSIYDVSWSAGGERVAACCSDNNVAIIDFRM